MNDEYQQLPDINCAPEETLRRIAFCGPCEDNYIFNGAPSCKHCNCSISLLTTVTYKTCPIGKW